MSAPTTGTVSVVVPHFEAAEEIAQALGSIAMQSKPPLEVIIVDDHSEKATYERLLNVVARSPLDTDCKVIRLEKNSGPGHARNVGLELAKGDYIAFLDSDEAWLPEKLTAQLIWMITHPDFAMSGHAMTLSNELVSRPHPSFHSGREVDLRSMLLRNLFPTSSVMVRSDVPLSFPLERHSEDYAAWLELVARGHRCFLADAPLVRRYKGYFGGGGLSGDMRAMRDGEVRNFSSLRRQRLIGPLSYPAAVTWSWTKYLRRRALLVRGSVLGPRSASAHPGTARTSPAAGRVGRHWWSIR